MQNKPSKWVPGFKHSPRSSNTQAFQMGLFLNVPTGKFEPIDSSWDNVHSGGLFISGANKIYFRDETNKDTYINSPADDQLALYASTVLIAKDTDGDGTGLVVSNLDTNNPPLASTIDMLEIGTVFGTADTYGFRLKYDGDTNNFEVQSGNETTVNTRMVIERDTGSVGIGQPNPSTRQLQTLASSTNGLRVENSTNDVIVDVLAATSQAWVGTMSAHDLVLLAEGTSTLTIGTSGDCTINNGNLVIGTAGKGIDFKNQDSPAPGMTAELLDRYEEGTCSLTVTGLTVTGSATSQLVAYQRVGNTVTVQGYITQSPTGASGQVRITGLPFTAKAASGSGVTMFDPNAIATTATHGVDFTAGYLPFLFIQSNTANLDGMEMVDDGAWPAWAVDTTSNQAWFINVSYTV